MDQTFAAQLAGWHDFYLMLATGAATLCGLLFVAISMNVDLIVREDKLPLRAVTKLTFILYMTVFFVALLILLPEPGHGALAWYVGIGGGSSLLLVGLHALSLWRARGSYTFVAQIALWVLVPAILNLALLRSGLALGNDDPAALRPVAYLLMLMLAVALYASWSLLVDVARKKLALDAEPPPGERAVEHQLRAVARELRAQNRRQADAARGVTAMPYARATDRAPRR